MDTRSDFLVETRKHIAEHRAVIEKRRASYARAQDAIKRSTALLASYQEKEKAEYQRKQAIAADLIKRMRLAGYGLRSSPPQVTLH